MNEWENSNLRKNVNSVKDPDHASDAARMDPLFDGTIYICVGTVSERLPQNLGSKNMSRSKKGKWTL